MACGMALRNDIMMRNVIYAEWPNLYERRIIHLDGLRVSDGYFVSSINSVLRRIMKQNSSEADSSVSTS